MTVQITSKGATLTYGNEGLVADNPKDVLKILKEKGVAVYRGVLNEDECKAMNDGMWDTAEHLTSGLAQPLKRGRSGDLQIGLYFGAETWRSHSGIRVGACSIRLGRAAEQKSGGSLPGTLWAKNTTAHEFRRGERLAWICHA